MNILYTERKQNMKTEVFWGIIIPFIGTGLGSAMVFFLKKKISDHVQKILTGFAAGVMTAASFWSLLQPALEVLVAPLVQWLLYGQPLRLVLRHELRHCP